MPAADNTETNASKAELWHTQCGLVAVGGQSGFLAWIKPLSRTRTSALRITGNLRVGGLAAASTDVIRSVVRLLSAFDFYIHTSIMRP